jgi:hypothetical protein
LPGTLGCVRFLGAALKKGSWLDTVERAWSGLPRWWKLVALCIGVNLTETGLVLGFDHGAQPDLAPQASAVAPLGVFGDLRWISVYHDSWFVFAAEIVAMLLVRGALSGVSVALAWPSDRGRPPGRALFNRGVLATALSALLLVPSVVVLFGLAAVPVSWLFLAAVPSALLVALIAHPIGVTNDWWRRPLSLRAIGWVALSFVTLSLAASAMAATPTLAWPIISALAGLFNAWSWAGLVRALVVRRPARFVVPAVPVAIIVLVGTVIGGTLIGFDRGRTPDAGANQLSVRAPERGQPVLLVSGYGSSWDGRAVHPIPGDFVEERFSYKGLSPQGRPLPYGGADTVKPLSQLARRLLAQVWSLYTKTGKEVDVVAESEGALVAKSAFLAQPGSPVSILVLASPLVGVGRVALTDGDRGWGVATNAGMRLLGDALHGVAPINLSPNNAFFSSLNAVAPALDDAMSCEIPGIHQFALLPLADATVAPNPTRLPFPSVVLPAFHGGLIESASGERILSQVLSGRPVSADKLLRLADVAISYAASAWQVPSLVPSDYPMAGGGTRFGTGSLSCEQVGAELRARLSLGA